MWRRCNELLTKQTRKGEHFHGIIRVAKVEHATISEEQSEYFPFAVYRKRRCIAKCSITAALQIGNVVLVEQ